MKIRRLTPDDVYLWKKIRLEALQEIPYAFGSSYEEESSWGDNIFENRLIANSIFGAFEKDKLVSTSCFHKQTSLKTQHRGFLWGMYTSPAYRGKGIGSKLMEHVIDHAEKHVIQLHLTCVTSNEAALAFYQKHGFEIYGTKPRSLYVDNDYYDEHLLAIDLADYASHETTMH